MIEDKNGEFIASKYARSKTKKVLWLNAKDSKTLKGFMVFDKESRIYKADFGHLAISPLNKCGCFHYYGNIAERKKQQDLFIKQERLKQHIYNLEIEINKLFGLWLNSNTEEEKAHYSNKAEQMTQEKKKLCLLVERGKDL